ncbi:MAG: hypothetical protein CVU51_00300 [Deltaproteobacteria bacterium HGW-Deltaproteobacteria-1]|jgi:hypothetical protein|nr:MAG: hypothetical protein CVU51_00300 [Deltaproteobacteria bacterium HGW-Deltaproteobacteria-1]
MKVKEKVMAEFRTVPLRVIHGAKIGRAALNNPDLPIEFIRDILVARKQGDYTPFKFGAE